ncbi:tetratricopeptide repeat protein [Aerosakkonema funiforme]|uniref:tetratricopeptide repeat protein n=1 Tax=Aerosakkonema funiforme TaxID=1246630 RepID=UPI0035BADDEC
MEQEFYNRGIEKFRQGDISGAIHEFNRVLRINPQFGDAYYQRGLAKFDSKDIQGAIEDYDRALQIDPHNIEAYFGRSLARLALGNMEAAIADADRLLKINPNYAPGYNLRATACRKLGNIQAAIANYKKAAEIYLEQKDVAKCRQCLDNIRQLQPPNPANKNSSHTHPQFNAEDFIERAYQKGISGQYGAAIEDFDWLLQLNYQDDRLYYKRGLMHSKLGYHLRAIDDFDRALSIKPNLAEAYYHRGIARTGFGDKFSAIADFEQAANLFQQRGDSANYQKALDEKIKAETYLTKAKETLKAKTDLFQVKIKRREGGTPIIDVLFNNRHTFEMLLDTGASHTTITPQMAATLNVVTVGIERAVIANGQLIESLMGNVGSIDVGGIVVHNLLIAIGAIPLLGQNFFGNYDLTIKQDVVEFRVRSKTPATKSEKFTENPRVKVSNELQNKLLTLVGGNWATAERLVEQERRKNPGKSENWYWEKVIYDLERDRGVY